MRLFCQETDAVERLRPITLARPAFEITCGGERLIDGLRRLQTKYDVPLVVSVRPHLRGVAKAAGYVLADAPAASDIAIDATTIPSPANFTAIESHLSLLAEGRKPSGAPDFLAEGRKPSGAPPTPPPATDRFHWPHDVVAQHMRLIGPNVAAILNRGDYDETRPGVFAGPGVTIGDYVVTDTTGGPILLQDNVKVGPYCFLQGPMVVGPGTRILEHSSIKDGVCIGHTCKIGGEVEASVIEPYTNKQHHGFLGHSYLGSWINLGAGTCNSDLKNTYGKINAQYGDQKVATEMQFFGCVMGDYSKSAINTGIFTGKIIGVCSMMYGFVTENVPSYVNYARLFGQTSPLPPEVMVNTQARMFARRKVEQQPHDIQLIHDMHRLTAAEREVGDGLVL